jgi:hypothetical protein
MQFPNAAPFFPDAFNVAYQAKITIQHNQATHSPIPLASPKEQPAPRRIERTSPQTPKSRPQPTFRR